MDNTLKDALTHEQKQIILFAAQHGSYKADTVAANYDEAKKLVDMNIMDLEANDSCLSGIRTLRLTITGKHLAKELAA